VDNFYTLVSGPNGCGKSTQGRKLANFLPEAIHTDMSDLITQKIKQDEDFRNQYAEDLAEGELLPDNVINGLFLEHSERIEYKNHILTGYPRTVSQDVSFMKYLNDQYGDGYAIDHTIIFELQMSIQSAVQRTKERVAQARAAGQKVREDDLNSLGEVDEEKIEHRYLIYNAETLPALDFFRTLGLSVIQVDATLKIHEIFARIITAFAQKQELLSS